MIKSQAKGRHGLTRREVLHRLMTGAGIGLACLQNTAAHPIHTHLANGPLLDQASAQNAAPEWTPKYLAQHQNETLMAVAERIVPNSGKAYVNRFIDLLLSVDSEHHQREFSTSLAVLDQEALRRFGHNFKGISEAHQSQLLTVMSTQAPRSESGDSASPGSNTDARQGRKSEPLTLRDHFENLKTWITGAYYSSEVGMRELGWTGVFFFPSFPGCQHPEGHS